MRPQASPSGIRRDHHLGLNARLVIHRALYGSIFIIALPLALAYWARRLDSTVHWPLPSWPAPVALALCAAGMLAIITATVDLAIFGHGMPMSAYPPTTLVTKGIYAWFSDPMYVGAVLVAAGLSLGFGSPAGLYVVTPALGLMAASWLHGYERLETRRRFGSSIDEHTPLFSLPAPTSTLATWQRRLALLARLFAMWLAAGVLLDSARASADGGVFAALFEVGQWSHWSTWLWLLPLIYVGSRLLVARTEMILRQSATGCAVAAGLSIYLYLTLPAFGLLAGDSAAWGMLATNTAAALAGINHTTIWSWLQRLSERVANSRRDWVFAGGRFQVINHAIFAGLAGAVGVGISIFLTGNGAAILIVVAAALVGAAVFAQALWGSGALLRPFGYWGAILGGAAGMVAANIIWGSSLWTLALACVLAAPWAQGLGRLRCLAQGCCHGTPTSPGHGIRVWQEQSRVVVLSGLRGQYISNTQLYSMSFNVLLGVLLWAAWRSGVFVAGFIVGLYLILTGIERFTEDAYRGEKQTRRAAGLLENQWIAIGALVIGMCFTVIPSPVVVAAQGSVGPALAATALGGGLLVAFAMSMDFPRSTLRFSRLSG